MAFGVRVVEDWKAYHPQSRQEMTINVTGLVVDVEAASEGVNV